MGLLSFGNKSMLVYLQNSGDLLGEEFSSEIISCDLDENEAESLFGRAINYIERKYHTYPIRWSDVMSNHLMADEDIEGSIIGDEIRDKCFSIDSIEFKGGYIGGGKTGAKHVVIPKITEKHIPVVQKNRKNFLRVVCSFDGGNHTCDLDFVNGNLDGIRNYQKVMARSFVRREKQKWIGDVHSKARDINDALDKIMDRLEE